MTHDTLLPEPLDLKDGWIDVTTKPGIGWELDDEKIAKYLPADFPKLTHFILFLVQEYQ